MLHLGTTSGLCTKRISSKISNERVVRFLLVGILAVFTSNKIFSGCKTFYLVDVANICYISGWVEPLLDRIARDPSNVVCPVIEITKDDTFALRSTHPSQIQVGGFSWDLIVGYLIIFLFVYVVVLILIRILLYVLYTTLIFCKLT